MGTSTSTSIIKVLLYVPNIIDYVRIWFLFIALCYPDNPIWFCSWFLLSMWLDDLDGYFARKFKQCSSFGAWLDVVIDNVSRGFVWILAFPKFGYIFPCIEWITFVCTHSRGLNWKEVETAPWIVTKIMENGCSTPLGYFATYCLYLLPTWCYCLQRIELEISVAAQVFASGILIIGRCLALIAETWFIQNHLKKLLMDDLEKSN